MRNDSTGSINNSLRSDSTTVNNGAVNNTVTRDSAANMSGMSPRNDSTGSINNGLRSDSTTVNNSTVNNTVTRDSAANMSGMSPRNDSTGIINNNSNMPKSNWSGSRSKTNSGTYQTNFGIVSNNQSSGQTYAGQSEYASLPVLETYVPDDIVSMVKSKYKSVYDITAVKESDGTGHMAYVVRYGDNGVYKTEKIGPDGNVIQ